jgi:hypothetical protein
MMAHVMLVIAFIVLIPAMWFGIISLLAHASGWERAGRGLSGEAAAFRTALHSRVGESRRGLLQALPYDLPRSRGNLSFHLADLSFSAAALVYSMERASKPAREEAVLDRRR